MFNKIKSFTACVMCAVLSITAIACAASPLAYQNTLEKVFAVNFLSVGQGDCAVINFPDGKVMLIDCGERTASNLKTVESYLDKSGCEEIDYLVLSHTDGDHTGNAAQIIEEYGVKIAYIPQVKKEEDYIYFTEAKNRLEECGAEIKISAIGVFVSQKDYFFCFLYPEKDSGYDEINYGDASSKDINAASSVVYLDYLGVKFLFTGDATKGAEEDVEEFYKAHLYSVYKRDGREVTLEGLNFLKVSHHGSKEEISESFYALLNAENAVVSVGALNPYGHPSVYTLSALKSANPDINILRTDVLGTVSVDITEYGKYTVVTDAD